MTEYVTASRISQGTFVRRIIFRNPSLNLKRIQKIWLSFGGSSENLPSNRNFWNARWQLRKKYGIKDLIKLPFYVNGKISEQDLIDFVVNNHKDFDQIKIKNFLRSEGFQIIDNSTVIDLDKEIIQKIQDLQDVNNNITQINPNAEFNLFEKIEESTTEQRARLRKKKFRRRRSFVNTLDKIEGVKHASRKSTNQLSEIEAQLDDMLQQINDLGLDNLVEALRNARRYASASILNLA